MVSSARPRRASASQQASTCEISAMSAMEQPALRSGRMTCWLCCPSSSGRPRTSALSAIKCTPQKTMYFASCFGGDFGELVAVAGIVGEANDLIALVVMAEHNCRRAELRAGCGYARVHGVVGECEVVFEAASLRGLTRRGRHDVVNNRVHCIPPSVQLRHWGAPNGDVESSVFLSARAAVDAPFSRRTFSQLPGENHPRGCCCPFRIIDVGHRGGIRPRRPDAAHGMGGAEAG